MEYTHESFGFKERRVKFKICLEKDPTAQISNPIIFEVLEHNFLSEQDVHLIDYFCEVFDHHLTSALCER